MAGEAMDQEVGRAQVTPRPARGRQGARRAARRSPAAAARGRDASRSAAGSFGRAVPPQAATRSSVRRSSQVIIGWTGSPAASVGMIEPACAARARETMRCPSTRSATSRERVEQRLPHLLGVLLHPARLRRQQRIGPAGGRHLPPARSKAMTLVEAVPMSMPRMMSVMVVVSDQLSVFSGRRFVLRHSSFVMSTASSPRRRSPRRGSPRPGRRSSSSGQPRPRCCDLPRSRPRRPGIALYTIVISCSSLILLPPSTTMGV